MDSVLRLTYNPLLNLVATLGQLGVVILSWLVYFIQEIFGESRVVLLGTMLLTTALVVGFVLYMSLYVLLKALGMTFFFMNIVYSLVYYVVKVAEGVAWLAFKLLALAAPSFANALVLATSKVTRSVRQAMRIVCFPVSFVVRRTKRTCRYWYGRVLYLGYDMWVLARLLFKSRSVTPSAFTYSSYGRGLATTSLAPPSLYDQDRSYFYVDYKGKALDEETVLEMAALRDQRTAMDASHYYDEQEDEVYHVFASTAERDAFLEELHAAGTDRSARYRAIDKTDDALVQPIPNTGLGGSNVVSPQSNGTSSRKSNTVFNGEALNRSSNSVSYASRGSVNRHRKASTSRSEGLSSRSAYGSMSSQPQKDKRTLALSKDATYAPKTRQKAVLPVSASFSSILEPSLLLVPSLFLLSLF